MRDELLNLIPDDILNLIWKKIHPAVKCNLNKNYFDKFYIYRLNSLNSLNSLNLSTRLNRVNRANRANRVNRLDHNHTDIKIINYKYIQFIVKNDLILYIDNILNYYSRNLNLLHSNLIYFNNIRFNNLVDMLQYFTNHYDSHKIKVILYEFIKKHNLSQLIKKTHKNNSGKNIRWTI